MSVAWCIFFHNDRAKEYTINRQNFYVLWLWLDYHAVQKLLREQLVKCEIYCVVFFHWAFGSSAMRLWIISQATFQYRVEGVRVCRCSLSECARDAGEKNKQWNIFFPVKPIKAHLGRFCSFLYYFLSQKLSKRRYLLHIPQLYWDLIFMIGCYMCAFQVAKLNSAVRHDRR